MGNGLYHAVSGSIGEMRNLEVLANNMAHVSTPGFKEDILLFEKKLQDGPGGRHTVDAPRTATRFSQGPVSKTDNPLDLALNGEGFFVVETDKGPLLTRSGRFTIGEDRNLHNTAGHTVLDEAGGPISIPNSLNLGHDAGPIAIDRDGNVFVGKLRLGTLKRVKAPVEALSKSRQDGFNCSIPIDQLETATSGEVLQGHLEQSNVNPVVAMTQMITAQRTFDALQRVIKTYRDVDSQSIRRAR